MSFVLTMLLMVLPHAVVADSPTDSGEPSSAKMSSPSHRQIELLRDARFSLGFRLIEPAPGKKTVIKQLQLPDVTTEPKWYLSQWNSRYCLSSAPRVAMPSGTVKYANDAKWVTFGQGSDSVADLVLGLDSRPEYQGHARKNGQPWPHLLIEQDDVSIHLFKDITQIHMHVEARLLSSERFELAGYTPDLHTAQFQLTLIIQNRNQTCAGFGDFIWFNVQMYDERYRSCPLYAAQDTADPSAKMIYSPPTSLFTDKSVHDGQWVTFSKDIYPVIQEALNLARTRGYLSMSPDNEDFAVSSVILGWEVPGVSYVQMQVRNLRLNITRKSIGEDNGNT
jgi:hypothetical protein